MKKKLFLVVIILFLLSIAVGTSQASVFFEVNGGVTFLGNSDTVAGAISPFIPTFGLSVPIYLNSMFLLLPGIDLGGQSYLYNGKMALPTEIENREYVVLISDVDIFACFNLPLSQTLELGIGAGPSFLLRLPIAQTEDDSEYNNITNWFYSDFKYIYPGAIVYLRWNLDESFSLVFSARGLFPVHHLWSDDGLPFWDQMYITGKVGLSFSL